MRLEEERVRDNIQAASTSDLLDRVTFYRAGMEPAALALMEAELHRRGVADSEIAAWGPQPGEDYVWLEDGTVAPCSFCRRPAQRRGWGWQLLWRKVPIFPRRFCYCEQHDPLRGEP